MGSKWTSVLGLCAGLWACAEVGDLDRLDEGQGPGSSPAGGPTTQTGDPATAPEAEPGQPSPPPAPGAAPAPTTPPAPPAPADDEAPPSPAPGPPTAPADAGVPTEPPPGPAPSDAGTTPPPNPEPPPPLPPEAGDSNRCPGGQLTFEGNTAAASGNTSSHTDDALSCDAWGGSRDAIHSFVAPQSGFVTVTITADFDAILYADAACGQAALGCTDNTVGPGSETVRFPTTMGAIYYVVIDAWASNFAGPYTITVSY